MVDSETKIAILFHQWARPRHDLKPESTGAPTGERDGVVRHLGADDRSSTRVRIVDGALRCLARQGIAKTTVDDIARAAGLSRATAYRTFPRGKEGILAAVVETEVARLFSSLAVAMGEAADLEDVLVAGMVESARWLRWHAALTYLLEHEPGAVLPYLTFGGFDRVMLVAGDLAAPFFARWLEPEQASRAAEWAVRIVMAYCSDPSPHADLTDPADTRALVRTLRPARHPRPARRRGRRRSRSHVHVPLPTSRLQTQTTHHVPPDRPPRGRHNDHTRREHSEQLRSNLELIGRENIDDLEAVLSFVGQYDVEGFHRVPDNCPAEFTWDYEKGAKPQLDKLYEKAKKAQWNGQTDLDWSIEVDQERVVIANAEANPAQMQWDEAAMAGTVLEKWDEKRFIAVRDREPELAAVAVHARRAGRAALHGQDRRDRPVDRRQVLRRHAGDGRGPPRRGLLQVPRREALGPLPDERPPRPAARRHRRATPGGT